MTIRFYILPLVVVDGTRCAKYFSHHGSPGITGIRSLKDYGSINQCVLCADISAADHAALSANADVLSIPVNIDGTLNTGARNTARTFCETYNIPGGWITTGMTYRQVLRTVTAFFLFFQRVNGILQSDIDLPAGWLDIQVQNIPAGIRTAMAQAAAEKGYDYSSVTPTTTMRAILKMMADAWGSTPILFGIATL